MEGRLNLENEISPMLRNVRQTFHLHIIQLLSEVHQVALATEQAIGDISIEEAWTGIQHTVDDFIRKHR